MSRKKHTWLKTARLRKQSEEVKASHDQYIQDWLKNTQHHNIFTYNEGAKYWYRYQSGCGCRVCKKPIGTELRSRVQWDAEGRPLRDSTGRLIYRTTP